MIVSPLRNICGIMERSRESQIRSWSRKSIRLLINVNYQQRGGN